MVEAAVSGPLRSRSFRLLVDTGATLAVLDPAALRAIGCDPNQPVSVLPLQGFGIAGRVPVILVPSYTVLERIVRDIETVAFAMPRGSSLDGVLGLNVLRALGMRIDFRASVLEVDDAT